MPAHSTVAAHEADFCFSLSGFDGDELRVVRFSGTEALGEFFRFRLELTSTDDELDPAELLGRSACLELRGRGESRAIHGILSRFERVGNGRSLTHYAAELVPQHWLLTQRFQSRIFQEHNCPDMSVPGIVARVLATAGIAGDRYRFALAGQYAAREYVVQYRESDADFVRRLLEDEGIYFYFEHTASGHCLVFADRPESHAAPDEAAGFPFRDPNDLLSEDDLERFDGLREERSIVSGAVTLDDYHFRQPGLDLEVTRPGAAFSALEHSDYPGGFVEKPEGERLAALRLEELACRARTIELRGNVRPVWTGRVIALSDHRVERFNRTWLVTRLEVSGVQTQSAEHDGAAGLNEYRVTATVLPAELPYRLPRRTPRPVVRGSQTALVVGPQTEEIFTDPHGRVKVQFHWDRTGCFDEFSSCWIRVSQGLAGGAYGMLFLPRVGQEVVVDFLEGDPDKPLVTGRVYNSDHMPPYSLPEHKTRSCIKTHSSQGGGGTNEIRFEDAKGKEHLLLYAQRTLHQRSRGSTVQSVGWNHHLTVRKDKRELVKENKHVDVVLDQAVRIGGNKSLEVWGDVIESVGNHSEMVWGRYLLEAEKQVVIEAQSGITLRCGQNFITIDENGIHLSGTAINLNSGGAPLVDEHPEVREPEKPRRALGARPGHDTRYTRAGDDPTVDPKPTPGGDDPIEPKPTERSWIEIEMVEELGQPWANEAYEVIEPDGRVHRGRLDERGLARVSVRDPGVCQIRFPNLDLASWRRAHE